MSINPVSLKSDQAPSLPAIIEAAKARGQKVRRALLASAAANAKDNKDGAVMPKKVYKVRVRYKYIGRIEPLIYFGDEEFEIDDGETGDG